MIKAVYQFLVVFFQVIFPAKRAVRIGGLVIRLLYATAGRSIVASNGQAYHRAVRQADRALHQSFAESAPTYDYTSVPILNGSGYDFTGGCGIFIHLEIFRENCCTVCDFFDEKVSNLQLFTLPDGNQQLWRYNMIDNEIRKQYRQVINDLKVAVIKTWAYRICEQAVERLRKILN